MSPYKHIFCIISNILLIKSIIQSCIYRLSLNHLLKICWFLDWGMTGNAFILRALFYSSLLDCKIAYGLAIRLTCETLRAYSQHTISDHRLVPTVETWKERTNRWELIQDTNDISGGSSKPIPICNLTFDWFRNYLKSTNL